MTNEPILSPKMGDVLEPLRIIHPDDGGWVTFHAPRGKNPFAQVTALRPRDLDGLFPELITDLTRDAYYSINGLCRPWRLAKLVANLNAIWLDVDFHDDPEPWMATARGLARVMAMGVTGEIPEPTLYVRSGRGFWVFWRLREADGRALSTKTPHVRQYWARLARGVGNWMRAAGFPIDGGAMDMPRLTRLPESVNSKSGSKVKYTINKGRDGGVATYTLAELARGFNIELVPTIIPVTQRPHKDRSLLPDEGADHICGKTRHAGKGRSSGWWALRDRRLNDLAALIELRDGHFTEGYRNRAVTLLSALWRGQPDWRAQVSRFATTSCRPPLTRYEIGAALKAFDHRRFKITDLKIGDWLQIQPAEAVILEGGDKYLKPRQPRPTPVKLKRRDRRQLISELWDAHAYPLLTLRQLAGRLSEAGYGASVEAIRRDLKALGIVNPRRQHRKQEAEKGNLSIFPNRGSSLTQPSERGAEP